MVAADVLEELVLGAYFSMALVVIHHLVEQGCTDSVEVDPFTDGSPPQMEMADRLLESHASFILTCRLNGRRSFEPSVRPRLLKDPSDYL